MARAREGPAAGDARPQPWIKYCPVCRGDLAATPSNRYDADRSHNYQCRVYDRILEINLLDRRRDENPFDAP